MNTGALSLQEYDDGPDSFSINVPSGQLLIMPNSLLRTTEIENLY